MEAEAHSSQIRHCLFCWRYMLRHFLSEEASLCPRVPFFPHRSGLGRRRGFRYLQSCLLRWLSSWLFWVSLYLVFPCFYRRNSSRLPESVPPKGFFPGKPQWRRRQEGSKVSSCRLHDLPSNPGILNLWRHSRVFLSAMTLTLRLPLQPQVGSRGNQAFSVSPRGKRFSQMIFQ